jgi:regulatory protein
MRLHSACEVKDYLYRKTRPTRDKNGGLRLGVALEITDRVFERLLEKGYVDDEKFARFWVENRSVAKGISKRKLVFELHKKGVSSSIVDQIFSETERKDSDEIKKIIAKKRAQYPDNNKLIAYLARQGFSYDEIKSAI